MDGITNTTTIKAHKAVKVYSRALLSFYDLYVFKCVSPVFFQCPEDHIVKFYLANISKNHLEVGVGTGYLLKKCLDAGKLSSVALLDLNDNCLSVTKKRLFPINCSAFKANILEELPFTGHRFDSIGLNYVLHCIPGTFKEKGEALGNLGRYLNDGGLLFGSTAIYHPGQNLMAKLVMDGYNRNGIFNNRSDIKEELARSLSNHFSHVRLDQIGNVLFFMASNSGKG